MTPGKCSAERENDAGVNPRHPRPEPVSDLVAEPELSLGRLPRIIVVAAAQSGLGNIAASLQGPVLRYTPVIGIIGFFIALALSGGHGGVVKGALTMGLIVCAAAVVPSVFLPMLGITGGLLI